VEFSWFLGLSFFKESFLTESFFKDAAAGFFMAVFEISKYKIFKPKQLQTFIFVVW
jgi:hypothetical protein